MQRPLVGVIEGSTMEILETIAHYRVIPLVVLHKPENAGLLGDALVEGGLPLAEVSFSTAGANQIVHTLAKRGDMLVGAATVLTADQVDEAVEAGAQYIASPGNSPDVQARCAKHGIRYLAGVATATEIQRALADNLTTLRLFPAGSLGGVAGVKMLGKSFPQVSFIPVGGVGGAHIRDYLNVRSVPAVSGSWMVPGQALRRADFKEVRDRTSHAVRLARSARKPSEKQD